MHLAHLLSVTTFILTAIFASGHTAFLKDALLNGPDEMDVSTLQWIFQQNSEPFLAQFMKMTPDDALSTILRTNRQDEMVLQLVQVCVDNGADVRYAYFNSLYTPATSEQRQTRLEVIAPYLEATPIVQKPWGIGFANQRGFSLYATCNTAGPNDFLECIQMVEKYETVKPTEGDMDIFYGIYWQDDQSVAALGPTLGHLLDAGCPIYNCMIGFALVNGISHPRLEAAVPVAGKQFRWMALTWELIRHNRALEGLRYAKGCIEAGGSILGDVILSETTSERLTWDSYRVWKFGLREGYEVLLKEFPRDKRLLIASFSPDSICKSQYYQMLVPLRYKEMIEEGLELKKYAKAHLLFLQFLKSPGNEYLGGLCDAMKHIDEFLIALLLDNIQ